MRLKTQISLFNYSRSLILKLKPLELTELFFNVEMPLVFVLNAMELEGIKINESSLKEFSVTLNKSLSKLKKAIFLLAEEEFNIDSPKQLGEILFGKMLLNEKAKKTKTGQYKTDESTLNKLSGSHEIIDHILQYRTEKKLLSTYVDALPKLISEKKWPCYFSASNTSGEKKFEEFYLDDEDVNLTKFNDTNKSNSFFI